MAKSNFLGISRKFSSESYLGSLSSQWKLVDCKIQDPSGKVYFEMKAVEAPADWTQLAVEIAASKYFRKKGVPRTGSEKSVRQMIQRVSSGLEKITVAQGYFGKKEAQIFATELQTLLTHQMGSFNSPVWFNFGLYSSYKIESPHRSWGWSPKAKKIVGFDEAYQHPQVSACFIQKVEDSLESIFQLVKTEALLFKYGSGSGTNFSSLRSKYEELDSGGTSSGLISFLEVLDRGAGAIKSGGTTRRAAKMVVVDIDHPEVEDFILWKSREEKKAKTLIEAGYSSGMDGEAYKTVAGQNGNNSVRVTDQFMKAVVADKNWSLKNRQTGKIIKQLKARELWRLIAKSAWECADPGLQFHDSINRMNPVPVSGSIRASNPCSEFMFLDDSACNLSSLNLTRFWKAHENHFDVEAFQAAARLFLIAQDAFVDHAGYPSEKIAMNSHAFRPLGIGVAGLGALLMRMGIPYDSPAGRAWAGALIAILSGVAYQTSSEIAQSLGPFPEFKKNKTQFLKVLNQHQKSLRNIEWKHLPQELKLLAQSTWKNAIQGATKFGVRNSQVTLIAPTGTIGLVMDSDTTGIEPEYSLLKIKKLAGGGEVQILSQSIAAGLKQLGYTDHLLAEIQKHAESFGSLQNCSALQNEHKAVFATAQDLSPEAHLMMMAAAQPFLSGAISKTVNLPSRATIEDIEMLHLQAWKLGLKSIAIYRDGSKNFQPLRSIPKCAECGSETELVGSCWRCSRCGFVLGCS